MVMINVMPAVQSLLMQDRVNVYRRSLTSNGYGEGKTNSQKFENVPAVVGPSGQNKLDRRPEAQSTEKVIEIIANFAFTMASPGFQADVVEWRGESYTVTSVLDYSQYGAGFTQAMAEARPMTQRVPEVHR